VGREAQSSFRFTIWMECCRGILTASVKPGQEFGLLGAQAMQFLLCGNGLAIHEVEMQGLFVAARTASAKFVVSRPFDTPVRYIDRLSSSIFD